MYSNSSPRLVSRVHLNVFPTDSAFSITGAEFMIFSASISFRCIPISTLLAATRDGDSLGHSSRRSTQSKTGNGFGGNGSDLVFFARRGKTRRSINSETNERWDAGFCTGWIAVRRDGKTARVRKGREGVKRDGAAEGGRGALQGKGGTAEEP